MMEANPGSETLNFFIQKKKELMENVRNIVKDLRNALSGNGSVNMNTDNNRRETVFYAVRAGGVHGAVRSLLPGFSSVQTRCFLGN
jgi:hypothetical protein